MQLHQLVLTTEGRMPLASDEPLTRRLVSATVRTLGSELLAFSQGAEKPGLPGFSGRCDRGIRRPRQVRLPNRRFLENAKTTGQTQSSSRRPDLPSLKAAVPAMVEAGR